jgi:hypothetical protein
MQPTPVAGSGINIALSAKPVLHCAEVERHAQNFSSFSTEIQEWPLHGGWVPDGRHF